MWTVSIMEPDRGIRRALGMEYLRRLGGLGLPEESLIGTPWENGMSLYAALGLLLYADPDGLPVLPVDRIFTRFLTTARRVIDARQLYRHERDVFQPTHRDVSLV
jgi:hypothetical protein